MMGKSVQLMNNNRHILLKMFGLWAGLMLFVLCLLMLFNSTAQAASKLEKYLPKFQAGEIMPGADGFGEVSLDPPHIPILKNGELAGYALVTTDYVNAIGYSGKPIHIAVGLDLDGTITGTKLVKHSEPIVLIGIPEKRIVAFMEDYTGMNAIERAGRARDAGEVDMISGATVTIMVIEDAIFRAAIKFARETGLGGLEVINEQPTEIRSINEAVTEIQDFETLLGDGSVRRRLISLQEINDAFDELGNEIASKRREEGAPDEVYIDLYMAPVTVPAIGRSLLGEAEYQNMLQTLEPGQQAILVFANGRFSFKGSGYVRGGVFDRVQLIQDEASTRWRDKVHKRLGEIYADGAPEFTEVGLFRMPTDTGFDVTSPFRLELLANRAIGPIKKLFLAFDLDYQLPGKYMTIEKLAPAPAAVEEADVAPEVLLWQRMWNLKKVDSIILCVAIGLLTLIFFFQDWLVRRPKLLAWTRNSFLVFSVLWIGFYAQAQLSVVNVLTFANSLMTNFSWNYFLMEPMIFLLWFSVAAALLFWGRGAYCGWLCPFGALQELLNKLAKKVNIPQYQVPWGLHERLWPLKYMIFLGLFGLSLYSLSDAELLAEVEPFKTSIILKFVREWPFVLYAVALLAAGLFIERFYCRYLCPLGAALAIPGRLRMFDWLKRYKECGSPCQRCANECMVQAIHPEGHINPNECLSCLHCQEVYCDAYRCPVVIAKRLKRERRAGRSGKQPATKNVEPLVGREAS